MNSTKSIIIFGILAVGVILANLDSINASPTSESENQSNGCPPGIRCLDLEEAQRLRQEWLADHPEETSNSDTETQATVLSAIKTYVPSLSCILFKELGCDVQCKIVGNLIATSDDISGTCDKSLACVCTAKSINKAGSDQSVIEAILTDEETPEPEILEYIKHNVEPQVGPTLKNSSHFDSTASGQLNWVSNYLKFLNKNKQKSFIQKVYHQTRLTGNDYLQRRLDLFLKKKGVQKENKTREYPQDNTIPQIVANMVANGMMNELGIPKSSSD